MCGKALLEAVAQEHKKKPRTVSVRGFFVYGTYA